MMFETRYSHLMAIAIVIVTCEEVHGCQLHAGADAGDDKTEEDGESCGGEDHGEQLRPGVGHLGDDELAADVGEHCPGQEEHGPGVQLQDVVGREQHPDEEQDAGH